MRFLVGEMPRGLYSSSSLIDRAFLGEGDIIKFDWLVFLVKLAVGEPIIVLFISFVLRFISNSAAG